MGEKTPQGSNGHLENGRKIIYFSNVANGAYFHVYLNFYYHLRTWYLQMRSNNDYLAQ